MYLFHTYPSKHSFSCRRSTSKFYHRYPNKNTFCANFWTRGLFYRTFMYGLVTMNSSSKFYVKDWDIWISTIQVDGAEYVDGETQTKARRLKIWSVQFWVDEEEIQQSSRKTANQRRKMMEEKRYRRWEENNNNNNDKSRGRKTNKVQKNRTITKAWWTRGTTRADYSSFELTMLPYFRYAFVLGSIPSLLNSISGANRATARG